MEQPKVGDHWTYDVHDEITGALKFTVTLTISDVSPTDITTRYERHGANRGSGYIIYDRSWNIKDNGTWKYVPNDGTGFKLPLKGRRHLDCSWQRHGPRI